MTRRVLIVEDEPDIVESLTFLLTRAGFVVKSIADGNTALTELTAWLPEVLILDAMLPGTNGFDILRTLRSDARYATVPILMLTAKGQRRDRDIALSLGADCFMTKPFANAEVIQAVKDLANGDVDHLP